MEKQKRRSRFTADPRGRDRHGCDLTHTRAHLALLDLLTKYRCLPRNYLVAGLPSVGRRYAEDVITFSSGEGFIHCPNEAKRHNHPNNRPVVYELSRGTAKRPSKLDRLLLEHGRTPPQLSNRQFRHSFLASIVQFSFDIAPREIVGLKKRTLADIKAHEDYDSFSRPEDSDHIRPDAPLFGYEYTQASGRKRYFYLHGFEIDRRTEPQESYSDRRTIAEKIQNYAAYLAADTYNQVYGISNLFIAFITINEGGAHRILDTIRKYGGAYQDRFGVKYIPDFTADAKPPAPTGHMLTEPWLTVGGTLSILEVLKHERKADDRRNQAQPHPRAYAAAG
jgi:hypothetical protein